MNNKTKKYVKNILILLVVLVFGALAIYGVGFCLFFNEIHLRRVKYPAYMKWLRYEIFASQMIKANFISFSAKQKIS